MAEKYRKITVWLDVDKTKAENFLFEFIRNFDTKK
jgi:hypothetical protein